MTRSKLKGNTCLIAEFELRNVKVYNMLGGQDVKEKRNKRKKMLLKRSIANGGEFFKMKMPKLYTK